MSCNNWQYYKDPVFSNPYDCDPLTVTYCNGVTSSILVCNGDILCLINPVESPPQSAGFGTEWIWISECFSPPDPYVSPTPTASVSPTPSVTPTKSITPSVTPTTSITPSITPSASITPSITPSVTTTPGASQTPSITPTASYGASVTPTRTTTPLTTLSPTVTPTVSPTPTPSTTPPTIGTNFAFNIYNRLNLEVKPMTGYSLPFELFKFVPNLDNTPANISNKKVIWNFGDNTTSTDLTAFHYYTYPGTFPVSLTVFTSQGDGIISTYLSAVKVSNYINDVILLTTNNIPIQRSGQDNNPIYLTRYNSYQTSISEKNTVIMLSVSGNYAPFFTAREYYSDKNSHLYISSKFAVNTDLGFTVVDSVSTTNDVIYASPSGSAIILSLTGTYDSVVAGTSGHALFYYIEDYNLPPSPTRSITPTPSITPSITPTRTITPSITPTASITPSVTPSFTPTTSITPSITPTASVTRSITPSITPTSSVTPSITPTVSISPSMVPTVTPSKSVTPTASITPTASVSQSITPTASIAPTASVTPSITPTRTPTSSITPTASVTPSITPTRSPSLTPTNSITPTRSIQPTPSPYVCTEWEYGSGGNPESIFLYPLCGGGGYTAMVSNGDRYCFEGTSNPALGIGSWSYVGTCIPVPSVTPSITPTRTVSITPTSSIGASVSPSVSISPTPSIYPTPSPVVYSLTIAVSDGGAGNVYDDSSLNLVGTTYWPAGTVVRLNSVANAPWMVSATAWAETGQGTLDYSLGSNPNQVTMTQNSYFIANYNL